MKSIFAEKKQNNDNVVVDDDDDDDKEVFKNVSFEIASRSYLKRKLNSSSDDGPNVCRLCELKIDQSNNEHALFFTILTENIGKMDLEMIFQIQTHYLNSKIISNSNEKVNTNFDSMSINEVKYHFLNCIHDVNIESYVQINQYKIVRGMLFDNLIQQNKMSETIVDLKILPIIEKINSKIYSLYKDSELKNLNF
jgi:hypothetical protein